MKLPQLSNPTSAARVMLRLTKELTQELDCYSAYYHEFYQQEIKQQELLRLMVGSFLESDKAFQRWRKSKSQPKQPKKN